MSRYQPSPLRLASEKDIARFWSKVNKSPGQGPKGECWGWLGGNIAPGSYGQFWLNGGSVKAHRMALFLATGIDPYPLLACHTCDWTPCCLADHLFRGSVADNIADRHKKGRDAHGLANGAHLQSKLTKENALDIRNLYATGKFSTYQLAARFNVGQTTIRRTLGKKDATVDDFIRNCFWL